MELSHGENLEELDRCRMRVQASPVDVLLPSALEVHPEGLQLRPALPIPGLGHCYQLSPARQCCSFVSAPRALPCWGSDRPVLLADRARSEQQEHPGVWFARPGHP